jgi:hypothetical protein
MSRPTGGRLTVPPGFHRGEPGYVLLLERQGGRCAICNEPDGSDGMELVPDHDHTTGRPRGLLCHRCNVGLGMLGDDGAWLRRAATYVDSWRLAHAEERERIRAEHRAARAGVRRSNLYGPNARAVP